MAAHLKPCPSSPNCVCSDDVASEHQIAPLALAVPPEKAWQTLLALIKGMPRTHLVAESADYLHVEFTSLIFRFVDDVEFQLRPEQNIIAVRSASRVGYSDLGANRQRVESIRAALHAQGIVP